MKNIFRLLEEYCGILQQKYKGKQQLPQQRCVDVNSIDNKQIFTRFYIELPLLNDSFVWIHLQIILKLIFWTWCMIYMQKDINHTLLLLFATWDIDDTQPTFWNWVLYCWNNCTTLVSMTNSIRNIVFNRIKMCTLIVLDVLDR